MDTIYLALIPIVALVVAAFDPTDRRDDYIKRGLAAVAAGLVWPGLALVGIIGLTGWAGSKLMKFALNKWPDRFK